MRVGGAWKTTMMNAAGDGHVCSGAYTVLDRPRRVGLTWGWLRPDGTRGHDGDEDRRKGRWRDADDAQSKDVPERRAKRAAQ